MTEEHEPAQFSYEVQTPDPDAATIRRRKQGQVRALARDEVEAGFLTYGLGPGEDCVSVTWIQTHEQFQRRGCATGLVLALKAAYPDHEVVDGGSSNSVEGDLLRESLEALRNSQE